MLTFLYIVLGILVFMFGASIFSFLNVVIYRLPLKMNMVSDRSICPKCKNQLKAIDLVPLLSYLFLGGKCRYCKDPISIRYPIVEALGGALALLCVHRFPGIFQPVLVFLFLCVLTCVAYIDHDTMEIPNELVFAALLCGIAAFFAFPQIDWVARLIGLVCVSVPMFLLTLVIPGAFGGGDIKLMAACGLFLGWKLTLFATFLAILGGGFYGIYLLAAKKKEKKDHFAFGPFLCIGMGIAIFAGDAVLTWYLGLILL